MRAESPGHFATGRRDSWDAASVLIDPSLDGRPLDFTPIFGNGHPVEVEIGTGKGTFLLARARARPEVNFLGIEWARQYCLYAADRFRRAGLTNVAMLRDDAGPLFRNRIPARSILRVHIYFPDPWPKRRHHRRRLIQPSFIQSVRNALLPGGQLLIVTDHLDYFQQIQAVLDCVKGLARIPFPQMADTDGQLVGTNFERKYIAQGRAFYPLARMRYV